MARRRRISGLHRAAQSRRARPNPRPASLVASCQRCDRASRTIVSRTFGKHGFTAAKLGRVFPVFLGPAPVQYGPHEDRDTRRRPGRAHCGVPPVARRIERGHGRRHQRRGAARPAGSPRHPHRRRQRRLSVRARSRRLRLGGHHRRADLERRGQHDGLRGRVHAVPHAARRSRASARPSTRSHPKLFADEALSVDVWISPEQLVTEYIGELIKFPGRAAGARLRRRPRAAGGHSRAQGRPAGRPEAGAS